MGAGSPPARVPARQPGQSGQDGAQVRTTALVAGCKRASPSTCVLRSVTHLWTGFVTHVDVCYKDAFSRARGQSAPRPARRDDLREKKSPHCSRASNVVSNAEISILQTRKTPRPTSTALNCHCIPTPFQSGKSDEGLMLRISFLFWKEILKSSLVRTVRNVYGGSST